MTLGTNPSTRGFLIPFVIINISLGLSIHLSINLVSIFEPVIPDLELNLAFDP